MHNLGDVQVIIIDDFGMFTKDPSLPVALRICAEQKESACVQNLCESDMNGFTFSLDNTLMVTIIYPCLTYIMYTI